MKKLGGWQNFFMRNRGVTKNIKRLLGGYKFYEHFVQWNIAPKMLIFRATRIGVYSFFNIVALEGGHKIFDHQIGGSQKYCRGTFGNSWPPNSKENGGPLIVVVKSTTHSLWLFMCVFTRCRKFSANPDQSGLGKVRGTRIDLDQRFHVASPTVLLVAKFNVNKPCSICIPGFV